MQCARASVTPFAVTTATGATVEPVVIPKDRNHGIVLEQGACLVDEVLECPALVGQLTTCLHCSVQ